MVFGERRGAPTSEPQAPGSGADPRAVLADVLLPALMRPPCLVAFSGGRDSSAVLGAATHVAREHGLGDPVPVTMRYRGHRRTWEDEWQELVVRHLELKDWEILEITSELDLLGPLAQAALRRHGQFWPPNAHAMSPLMAVAAGGSLLTGNGGDEIFTPWSGRQLALIRSGRLRPRRQDLKWMAMSLAPYALRVLAWRLRSPVHLPWLRPPAQREVQQRLAKKLAHEASSEQTWLTEFLTTRYLELARGIFGALADDAGVRLVEPFFDPRFVRAVALALPPNGYPSRSAAIDALFGDLLPAETVHRSTKATFTEVLWGPQSRAFAASSNNITNLFPEIVDPARLAAEWAKAQPDFRSMTALQAAWLAEQPQP